MPTRHATPRHPCLAVNVQQQQERQQQQQLLMSLSLLRQQQQLEQQHQQQRQRNHEQQQRQQLHYPSTQNRLILASGSSLYLPTLSTRRNDESIYNHTMSPLYHDRGCINFVMTTRNHQPSVDQWIANEVVWQPTAAAGGGIDPLFDNQIGIPLSSSVSPILMNQVAQLPVVNPTTQSSEKEKEQQQQQCMERKPSISNKKRKCHEV